MAPATFQEVILRLQEYWAQKGCVVLQPLDMEVGAGTFHPATFLRALGPENWNAAYVQPSRRPADGRYGENPNRLQHYYQFQVVMKPSPADFQDLYLGSLYAKNPAVRVEPDLRDRGNPEVAEATANQYLLTIREQLEDATRLALIYPCAFMKLAPVESIRFLPT